MNHPAGNPQCTDGAEAQRRTMRSSSNIDSATTSIARPPSSIYSSTILYGPRAAESLRSSSNEDRLVRIIQLLDEAFAIFDDHEAALDIVVAQDDKDFQEGTGKMKRDDPHKQ
jgi:hypothetical protein